MLTRQLSREEWLNRCWNEIAERSVEAGISVQDARDGAVIVRKLVDSIGGPDMTNVVSIADARAVREAQ